MSLLVSPIHILAILQATTTQEEPYPIPVEEDMAIAEALLAAEEAAGGSFLGGNSIWFIVIGVIVLAVAVMLLILAGRYRRQSDNYDYQQDPLFDPDMPEDDQYDSPFAEVLIEDESVRDERFAQAMDTTEGYQGEPTEEEEPQMADYPTEDQDEGRVEEEADSHPNVVPLRTMPDDPQEAEADAPEEYSEPEVEQEEELAPRYAFATGRAAANETSFAPSGYRDEEPSQAGAQASAEDRDRPYVAPFIRDDIERAERRQSDRIDRLRQDFVHQFDTLKSEQSSRLDLVIAAIDRKLDSLDRQRTDMMAANPTGEENSRNFHSLNDQVQRISASIDGQGQRIRAITQILETKFAEVGRIFDEVKGVHQEVKSARSDLGHTGSAVSDVRGDLDDVKEHVGRLERAILDRAAQDSSTTVRLADVVRGTLPDGSYEFGAALANGETADCLIRFDGIRHRIAVDGGFPMEAFHELPSRDAVRRNLPQAKTAEDSFRRAILRSILEAADRCISPGETADSCLLFLPSEAAYTILHDRFPDLVRDSQRARVWLVSPSTLMGTLHLVRSLLPDTGELARREVEISEVRARQEEDNRLRDEVNALRQRAGQLAEELERTRGTLRNLIAPPEAAREEKPSQASPSPESQGFSEPPSAGISWGSASSNEPSRVPSEPSPASAPRETDRYDDEEIIESLSFEGTPDWQSPLSRETGPAKKPFDPGRDGPLR